jgi:hypothetical protein
MLTSEYLKRAKAVMLARGWTTGTSINHVNEVCVYGALAIAGGAMPTAELQYPYARGESEARRVFLKAVGSGSIIIWNDATGRTPEQVLAAFDAAIALAEAEETISELTHEASSPMRRVSEPEQPDLVGVADPGGQTSRESQSPAGIAPAPAEEP